MINTKAVLITSLVILTTIALVVTTSYFVNSSYEDKYDETTNRMKEKYILEMQSEIDAVGCDQSIESYYETIQHEICVECNDEFSDVWDYKPGFGTGYYEEECRADVSKAVLLYRKDVCFSQFD